MLGLRNAKILIGGDEMVKEVGRKLIAQNKAARHDYFIDETYECGLVLTGTEVKSLRAGRASLLDGFALINDGDRKSTRLNSSHIPLSRMPSSA